MAEREGFEPSIRFCRILTFQASAFDHSATAPHRIPIGRCEASGVNRVRNQMRLEGRPLEALEARGKLAARRPAPLWRLVMARRFDLPPSAEEIEAIARLAMASLPEPFGTHLADVVLQVDEFADDELLAEMSIDHPLDLTGVYEGIPIGQRSVETSGTLPDRIRLFRQPILAEWCEEGEIFEHLVRHILIHEVGHHFGLSDEDMHALEDRA